MPELKIVPLGNGWEVRVTPVPPHASVRWNRAHVKYPPKPVRPMVEIISKLLPKGSPPEVVPALPESDEWNAWVEEMTIWQAACDLVRADVAGLELDFSLDYAIADWRPEGSDEEWCSDVPDGWQPNPALARHGVEDDVDIRVAFIHYELMVPPASYDDVMEEAYPKGEQDTSPVTEEEVKAALGSFQPRGRVSGAAGNVGAVTGATGTTQQAARANVDVRQRDASRRCKEPLARRLVQWFKGS